ncbi:MAG: hypothetical protein ABSH16_03380 [Sedimentisphaerales bacterium]|jgi:hypothetical protein
MNKDLMIHVGIGLAAVAVIFLLYKNAKGTGFTSVGVGSQADLTWGEELENILETGNSQGYTNSGQGTLPTFLGLSY